MSSLYPGSAPASWLCRPVIMRPPVSTSLGYVVFQELGAIVRAPVHIGLLIDKQL
jgi:hypothetical protein